MMYIQKKYILDPKLSIPSSVLKRHWRWEKNSPSFSAADNTCLDFTTPMVVCPSCSSSAFHAAFPREPRDGRIYRRRKKPGVLSAKRCAHGGIRLFVGLCLVSREQRVRYRLNPPLIRACFRRFAILLFR